MITLIMLSTYVTYIIFCSINLQILDSLWVVIAQMFCMLQPTIQHLVKRVFVIEYEPKYTGKEYQYVLCY